MVWILDFIMNQKLMFILGIIFATIFKIASKNVNLISAFGVIIMLFLITSFFIGALFSFMGYSG